MLTAAQYIEQMALPTDALTVTPSDDTLYDPPLRAISIDAEGAVAVLLDDMTAAVTLPAGILAPGIAHPMIVRRVLATGTDLTLNILGWT
jgi:hypothetical protein